MPMAAACSPAGRVALLAEGVDRNVMGIILSLEQQKSPSSRRAWIEITLDEAESTPLPVALLAEGVDRNYFCTELFQSLQVALLAEGVGRNNLNLNNPRSNSKSPSSRKAWVEICKGHWVTPCWAVALLTEGVDRNMSLLGTFGPAISRPPRGGRG